MALPPGAAAADGEPVEGIVVGMDGSGGSATALRWALRESLVRGWPVTAVMTARGGARAGRPPGGEADLDTGRDVLGMEATLESAVVEAIGEDAAGHVRRHVSRERPVPALLDAAAGAELLVVGARGLGGFRRLLVGSVSDQCLHHTPCPIAIAHDLPAPPAHHDGGERIVVGIDGSNEARRALAWALDEARARKARIEVVHAWQPLALTGAPFAPLGGEIEALTAAAECAMDEAMAAADTSGLAAPPERTIVCSGAAAAVLEAAKGADLVVIGSRGNGGFTGLLLGSASRQVAHHATCPVVVVPARH